jgi:hypothetical protein
MTTTNANKDLLEVTHDAEKGLIFEKDVSANRPIAGGEKFPVLVTYGP